MAKIRVVDIEPQMTEPQMTEPQMTEPQMTEPQMTEPQMTEPQMTLSERVMMLCIEQSKSQQQGDTDRARELGQKMIDTINENAGGWNA